MLDTSKIPIERIEGYNNHITNCITKIPQDILLELSAEGVLTLKAGSKIYTPNGIDIFNITNIQTDITREITENGIYLLSVTSDEVPVIAYGILNKTFSGDVAPEINYSLWYDTAQNIVQNQNGDRRSLPIAIITVSDGKISEINQIFNGFGYIGNTVFIFPGVEGLIPNGFNEDGSLNNILCTINDIKMATTISGWNNHWYLHLLNENSIAYHPYELYFNQTSSPISMGQTSYWYNPNENMIYYSDDFGITWNSNRKITPFLDIIQDQEKIISITPKLVYQNNTKNDFNKKFQVVSELPTTPEVGVFYFVKE